MIKLPYFGWCGQLKRDLVCRPSDGRTPGHRTTPSNLTRDLSENDGRNQSQWRALHGHETKRGDPQAAPRDPRKFVRCGAYDNELTLTPDQSLSMQRVRSLPRANEHDLIEARGVADLGPVDAKGILVAASCGSRFSSRGRGTVEPARATVLDEHIAEAECGGGSQGRADLDVIVTNDEQRGSAVLRSRGGRLRSRPADDEPACDRGRRRDVQRGDSARDRRYDERFVRAPQDPPR